ncbi:MULTISPECIES: VanZ family protein [Anaerostipes]|uniref:VanZ family protein n=1 Tax=Anaerostipes TaxID=207244 RepID=UPI00258ADFE6|nr:VanZ family protein [Anaerostipes sp.]MCI5622757.1 VanZ family protein [Anaerostipes sp.]MDY2726680.1 VanZ family protein [Anaerostipes faecalis]
MVSVTIEKKRIGRFSIKILFYLYIILIFYFVLLSERYGRETGYQTSHVNFIFFKEIRRFWEYRHLLSLEAFITNLFGNIFAFSPFGFMIPIVTEKRKGCIRAVLGTFIFSLVIETSQLIMKVGVFDVDDLLLNTVGGFIGYILYRILLEISQILERRHIHGKK